MATIDELTAAVNSEPVRRFVGALAGMSADERTEICDRVLTGPPALRVDLGLPPGMELRRRMVGGPDCEFVLSKRDSLTGMLVSVFITLSPSPERVVRQVLPLAGEEN